MLSRANEYIQIDEFDKIGEFYANFGELKSTDRILKPSFKVLKKADNYNLLPGFLTSQGFSECPLPIFYIEILAISECIEHYPNLKVCIEMEFNLYSKDFSQFIKSKIKTESRETSFMDLNKPINIINKYIDSGNDLNRLNLSSVDLFGGRTRDKYFIRELVKKIDFSFYENSLNRMGRDDMFWNEAEVRNLPENNYLKDLFVKSLSKLCKRIDKTEYGIKLIDLKGIGVPNEYNSSFGRRKFTNEVYSKSYLVESLLMELVIEYNEEKYLFDRLKK